MIRVRRLVSLIALCSAISIAAAGCHKKVPQAAPAPPAPPPTAPAPPPPPPPPAPAPAPAPAPRAPSDEEVFARKSLDELTREMSDAFFDLNESNIREDAKPALKKTERWRPRRLARLRLAAE